MSICFGVAITLIIGDPQFAGSKIHFDVFSIILCGIGLPICFVMLTKLNRQRALKKTADDVKRYEAAWAEAGGRSKEEGEGTRNGYKIHAEPAPEQGSIPQVSLIDQHLQAIKKTCAETNLKLEKSRKQAWSDSTKTFSFWERVLFWIGAGVLGPYARTGKIRQDTDCIDSLFEQAANLNDDFFNALLAGDLGIGNHDIEDQLESGLKWQNVGDIEPMTGRELKNQELANALTNKTEFTEFTKQEWEQIGIENLGMDHFVKSGANYWKPVTSWGAELCRGPVKRPDRALQKVVRRSYRDHRCLTDLVRCCILLESIADVEMALNAIFSASTIHPGLADTKKGKDDLGQKKWFRICKMKDRFTTSERIGYRDICLNLQVGWTVGSETESKLNFVPVSDFGEKHVRTHICECQLLLRSMYQLKESGCHENFVETRNLLSQ